MTMKRIAQFPLHTLLLSIYPAIALMSANVSQIDLWLVRRPLLASLIFGCVLLGLAWWVFRSLQKAAIITSYVLLLFFSYGHIHQLLLESSEFLFNLSHHKFLGSIFILLLLGGVFLLSRRKKDLQEATSALNMIAAALVILAIIPVVSYKIRLEQSKGTAQAGITRDISYSGDPQKMPDIYYIILDSYTRADALQRDFDYDNSSFISKLEQIGFQVGDCSRSNYGFTELSISSTLNLNYLSALSNQFTPGNSDLTQATALIQNNYVRKQLKELGYKIVGFETGYAWNQWKDADLYVTPNTNMSLVAPLRPFEEMFLRSTAFRLIADTNKKLRSGLVDQLVPHHEQHVARTMTMLEWLDKDLPAMAGPKFVYAHINVPHVPFVFESDGSLVEDSNFYRGEQDYPVSEEYYQKGYINQVQFVNNRIPGIVENIIQSSERPVVIILQGDHGFMNENRLEILNAIYLGGDAVLLDRSMSPVNSFRIIFNKYFHGNFTYLENLSYLSTSELPYDLTLIPENAKECEK